MSAIAGHTLGAWLFDPRCAELRREGERRRLEDRASRTLELLCLRRFEVVSRAEIVNEVWNGRSLSPNSVTVVIADLRRALEDDARDPRYIETVAKRGYRLIAPSAAATPARFGQREILLLAGLAGAVAVGAVPLWLSARPPPVVPVVAVQEVENATGDSTYDPLARAVGELLVLDLRRAGVDVMREPSNGRALAPGQTHMSSRLILWTGSPAMALTVTDPRSGLVVWSAIMRGKKQSFPIEADTAMKSLSARLQRRRAVG